MTNLTNQDNVGNYYFGFRTNNFAFSPDQIGLTYSTLADWINTSFGETCAVWDGQYFALILPHPNEVLTRPALASQGQFKFRFGRLNLNTRNTDGLNQDVSPFGPFLITYYLMNQGTSLFEQKQNLRLGENFVYYCVLNNASLNVFGCRYSGNNLNPNSENFDSGFVFRSIGFVKNPLYSGSSFPRNAYYYFLDSDLVYQIAGRPDLENTKVRKPIRIPTSESADPIANYPIFCQTATPGANTTDLLLRDNDLPHKAIGSVPNVLKSTLDIPVGQIYSNTGIDPDGSNNPNWICVGKMGSESILMRVWAQGLN